MAKFIERLPEGIQNTILEKVVTNTINEETSKILISNLNNIKRRRNEKLSIIFEIDPDAHMSSIHYL